MKYQQLSWFLSQTIKYCFYSLFFLIPLILTPWNYELFEYNKMMLTYGITTIIVGAWISKMVLEKRILIRQTPFDIPIALFFISQVVSYFYSIDRHVSFWGYYSRFNGGLLSIITYILLFYAFISNIRSITAIKQLLATILGSGVIVAIYGILEHFGIDKSIWVQDVQNRVFSTLGQPNWLAAYLSILLPISFAPMLVNDAKKYILKQKLRIKQKITQETFIVRLIRVFYYLLPLIFYLALLYTKSRSGFAGFWVSNIIFWSLLFIWLQKQKFLTRGILKTFFILHISFFTLTFFYGSPFAQINRYTTYNGLKTSIFHKIKEETPQTKGPALETGGTESGEIRRIVWSGAIDIVRHYPFFGTGPETFAFAYYQFRPVEHNLTSEWDFLYNKAHNEYLNYAATTGLFGLGSYLLFIGSFILWSLQKIKNQKLKINFFILSLAFFCSWFSILVTNFFGFSVVIVALFFWIIPTISYILLEQRSQLKNSQQSIVVTGPKWIILCGIFLLTLAILTRIATYWIADTRFAYGYNMEKTDKYSSSYDAIKEAIKLNPREPFYHDEMANILSTLALSAYTEKQASLAATLENISIKESDYALAVSPNNVNFWKSRVRVFYALGQIKYEYNQKALEAIRKASKLAPTDAKIFYNWALIQDRLGRIDDAIETLKKTIILKPNYREPHFALALFYEEKGKKDDAINELQYILDHINSKDQQVKEKINELKSQKTKSSFGVFLMNSA